MLLINGPLALGADGALIRREVSWSTEFAMIYVDQPVGTGYSFAAGNESDVASYAASSYPEASNMVVELLDAVYDELKLWSRASPLLLTGESYAGHYCPAVAASILDANAARPAARRFNLQGVAIGDGLTDPPTQVRTKPAAALAFGLIGTSEHARCAAHAEAAAEAAAAGDFAAALRSRDDAMERELYCGSRLEQKRLDLGQHVLVGSLGGVGRRGAPRDDHARLRVRRVARAVVVPQQRLGRLQPGAVVVALALVLLVPAGADAAHL